MTWDGSDVTRAYQKQYRTKLKDAGMCTSHPTEKARKGTTVCDKCAEYKNKKYNVAKKNGMCLWHRSRPAAPGKTICRPCLIGCRLRELKRRGLLESETEVVLLALENFKGVCESCGTSEPGGKNEWSIDHNHNTKKFRGIICHNCNIVCGYAHDDPDTLYKIATYLEDRNGQITEAA